MKNPRSTCSAKRRPNLTVEMATLAYRIWAHCQPIGWNATAKEIGEALGVNWRRVNAAIVQKGWAHRMRAPDQDASTDRFSFGNNGHTYLQGEIAAVYNDFKRSLPHEDGSYD